MTYSVKEMFPTLQGEGGQAGRAAVFLRFAGCNLWTGREEDRAAAVCAFCDTEFVGTDGDGGGKFATAEQLSQAVADKWQGGPAGRLVVCTGGEPLLQLDGDLIDELHNAGFEIAVETNGTLQAPRGKTGGIDWICVSPKANAPLVLTSGQELKLVFPQTEAEAQPERFESLDFQHFYLQPMDSPARDKNTQLAVSYCLSHPKWRLSLQSHKYIGIP
ncbi:7-carboxy-7-deazaguanine synthase [Pyruvatibacter sp.]|uniref:7-carboxy-7-deazaguanine synthase n=1 Tax=Pyruvatibacter sp. TaxID=1981328 RepID=UPI003265EFD1